MNETNEFQSFCKIARLNREIIITEKLDGTNAQIQIIEPPADYNIDDGANVGIWLRGGLLIRAGSRNRWITPKADNYGFANWVLENSEELIKLGVGRHFGEWWGNGIQRTYGVPEKRFSLFNVGRWHGHAAKNGVFRLETNVETGALTAVDGPNCCGTVPILWRGPMLTGAIEEVLRGLAYAGSAAAPGFMKPEGIVIYHTSAGHLFKVTLENDESHKSLVQ